MMARPWREHQAGRVAFGQYWKVKGAFWGAFGCTSCSNSAFCAVTAKPGVLPADAREGRRKPTVDIRLLSGRVSNVW